MVQNSSATVSREAMATLCHAALRHVFRGHGEKGLDAFFDPSLRQHEPAIAEGIPGFAAFANMVAASPNAAITIYRTIVDGDIVAIQSKQHGLPFYRGPVVAFDMFRCADGRIVEHWRALEPEAAPNPSGRTQVDGPTEIADRDKTEVNRQLVKDFKQAITVDLRFDKVDDFVRSEQYHQHASSVGDGMAQLKSRIDSVAGPGAGPVVKFHHFLAEGNFVLALVEGHPLLKPPTIQFDLFRVESSKIVEHWDVVQTIAPRELWKNTNGPF
ncbi:MAG: putative lipoprotein [Ramlibacter sp.]|nr:putative lipoprotein [Ramlibacter sp.]